MSEAIASSARSAGADIRTNSPVKVGMHLRILVMQLAYYTGLEKLLVGDDCTPGRGIRDMMQPEANKPEAVDRRSRPRAS